MDGFLLAYLHGDGVGDGGGDDGGGVDEDRRQGLMLVPMSAQLELFCPHRETQLYSRMCLGVAQVELSSERV
jgi:hypothetical protein